MELPHWMSKRVFYFGAGMVFMVPVVLIARTSLFYLCYFPLMFAAILFSGSSIPEGKIQLPGKLTRLLLFVSGMIVCELVFSFVLIAKNELSFDSPSFKNDWVILAVEFILGIIAFLLFFGIATSSRYFFRKLNPK